MEADALEPELYAALEAVSDGGKRFVNQIKQLLAHEASFVTWKRDKCPAIDKSPVTAFPASHVPGTPWPGEHLVSFVSQKQQENLILEVLLLETKDGVLSFLEGPGGLWLSI